MCPLDISGGGVCGQGQGACCAGSNEGCPSYAPVCSEWGYCQENRNMYLFLKVYFYFLCQCSSYTPGGGECGPGFTKQTNRK